MIIATAALWDIAQGWEPFMVGFWIGGVCGVTIGVLVVASSKLGRG